MGLLKLRLLRGLAVAPSELMHSNTETVAGRLMSIAEQSWGTRGHITRININLIVQIFTVRGYRFRPNTKLLQNSDLISRGLRFRRILVCYKSLPCS